jgi:hypothetical protein
MVMPTGITQNRTDTALLVGLLRTAEQPGRFGAVRGGIGTGRFRRKLVPLHSRTVVHFHEGVES